MSDIRREHRQDHYGTSVAGENRQSESGSDDSLRFASFEIRRESDTFDEIHLSIAGRIAMENAEEVRGRVREIAEADPLKNIVIDLGDLDYFDSAGAAIMAQLGNFCRERGNSLKTLNATARVRRLLELADPGKVEPISILEPRPGPDLGTQIRVGVRHVLTTTADILTFIGASITAVIHEVMHPTRLRWDRLWRLVEKSGSDAVPIVIVLSFLMGAILAFQAAIQLRKFGANIFVADLVSLSICLEMGPLLTALIVAGRSGAAYAAHIGTMQVNEEVDALRVMAIDPVRYLVTPRIIAVALALPCLTLIADIMGVLGGCFVAGLSLDLTPTTYFNQVRKVLELSDVIKGLVKSFVFGVEIAMIGCLRGFQVRGGAEGVGSATTSAVVTSIFVLTVTDAIFAMLYHYVQFL